MKVNILFFGQLTDITGTDQLTIDGVQDIAALNTALVHLYPALASSKYITALNNQVITGNETLTDGCTVALLPPFSGG